MNPADALARVLDVPVGEIELIETLGGDFGNTSVRLRVRGTDFVVRCPSQASVTAPGVDRYSERGALQAAESASIGPRVIHCDPAAGLLITEYLHGSCWSAGQFTSGPQLERLGVVFATLHSLDVPRDLRRLELPQYVTNLELAAGYRPGERLALGRAIAFAQLTAPHFRLCHNDVHAGNVIDSDTLRLVDWEYAASGDPDFDLAAPICYHRLSTEARAFLLSGYSAASRPVESERLTAACWVFEYVACLWQLNLPGEAGHTVSAVAGIRQPVDKRLQDLERFLDFDSKRLMPLALWWA